MTPREIFQSLKRPVQFGIVASLVMTACSLFMPNTYKSEARILPADARSGSSMGQLAAAAAAVGVMVPGQDSADSAYVDIINSRWMREQLLENVYTFHEKTWYFGRIKERKETLQTYLGAKNRDQGVRNIKGCITVTRDLKTKLLGITVETGSADLSQQVCQRMVTLLDDFVVRRCTTKGGAKANFAKKRLEEAQGELTQAENALRSFLYANRNYQISADPSVRLKGSRLENEFKLRAQIVTTLAISLEQSLLEEKNDMPVLNVLDNGNLPLEKNRPARSVFVVMSFLIIGLATWLWENRAWVRQRMTEEGIPSGPKK